MTRPLKLTTNQNQLIFVFYFDWINQRLDQGCTSTTCIIDSSSSSSWEGKFSQTQQMDRLYPPGVTITCRLFARLRVAGANEHQHPPREMFVP